MLELMEWLVALLAEAFPQYSAKINELGSQGIVFELLSIPLRLAIMWLLYKAFQKAGDDRIAIQNEIKEDFLKTTLFIGLIYFLDMACSIYSLQSLSPYATLLPASHLIFNCYPDNFELAVFLSCTACLYGTSVFLQRLRPFALVGFLLLEALTYSFGYTENTFSSFKLILGCVCYSGVVIRYSTMQNLVMSVYFLAGMEKLFGAGFLNGSIRGLSLYGLSNLVEVVAVMIFQLAALFAIRSQGHFRNVWAVTALLFHLLVYLKFGIGGLASPWIVAIILAWLPALMLRKR